jgi:transposase
MVQENKENKIWCGIDVAKDKLSAALDVKPETHVREIAQKDFARTVSGVHDMLDWCSTLGVGQQDLCILMESTGQYSRELLQWFQNNFPGIHVSMGNPRRIKHFIDSCSLGNKTDRLDSMAIARMGTVQKPDKTPLPPAEYLQLQEMVRARDELVVKMRSLEVSCAAMPDQASFAASTLRHVVKVMAAELRKLEDETMNFVQRMPEIRAIVRRMCTMPGIGAISACTILSELGPFSPGHTRSMFSAYTGLQPVLKQSGTSVNSVKLSKSGSALLRKVLYLCSIHAIRKIPSLASLYSRILMKGRKPLTARCACMRKMLLILRSMVLNQRDFDPKYA